MKSDHYINGQWKKGSGPSFHSSDPATAEKVFEARHAIKPEIEEAVQGAQQALKSWKNLPLETRIAYLHTFSKILHSRKSDWAKAISQETGKPLWESHQEIQSMINKIPISIEAYTQRCPQQESLLASGRSIIRHRPHGVVAVLGPFNLPGHLPNGHIVPALLAGNVVIFKPSEYTPLAGNLLAQCWESAQLPRGVFNLIQGGKETGQSLISCSGLDGICFTGSWPVGKILLEHYALHPEVILALEMGGNNPLVVSKLSNTLAAAYITLQSAFVTAGQRCSCARRLIVVENAGSQKFIDKLQDLIPQSR